MSQNNNYNFDPVTGQPMNSQMQQPNQNLNNINFQQSIQQQVNNNLNNQVQQPMNNNVNNQTIQSGNMHQQAVQTPQINTGSVQQPMQPQQPKKSNKLIIILAILAIVGIIGIVVGIFIFSNQDKKEPVNNNDATVENNGIMNDSSNGMSDEEYTGTKQNITIATIGHVDHGKSTLTSAITKVYGKYVSADTISAAQEVKKNGITFNASFVEYETQTRHYSHYDLSGHYDYIKAIISGALKLDGAILVVSAADGPMAQTREQLKLINEVGVSKIVVYMSKCDLVNDEELLELVEMEIRELISEYGFDGDNTPVVRGSALKAIEGDSTEINGIRSLISNADKWIDGTNNYQNEKASSNKKFKSEVYMFSREEGATHSAYYHDYGDIKFDFSFNNSSNSGIVEFEEGVDMVMPGDNANFIVTLDKNMTFKKGDYFQIFDSGKLIGVGYVLEIIE